MKTYKNSSKEGSILKTDFSDESVQDQTRTQNELATWRYWKANKYEEGYRSVKEEHSEYWQFGIKKKYLIPKEGGEDRLITGIFCDIVMNENDQQHTENNSKLTTICKINFRTCQKEAPRLQC